MSVTEIEAAIIRLPAAKMRELMVWFEDHYSQFWEEQIEADLEAGKLDSILAEVEGEIAAGTAEPL